jgi:hypothetical protein
MQVSFSSCFKCSLQIIIFATRSEMQLISALIALLLILALILATISEIDAQCNPRRCPPPAPTVYLLLFTMLSGLLTNAAVSSEFNERL